MCYNSRSIFTDERHVSGKIRSVPIPHYELRVRRLRLIEVPFGLVLTDAEWPHFSVLGAIGQMDAVRRVPSVMISEP